MNDQSWKAPSSICRATILLAICAGIVLAGCATRPPADDPVAVAEFKETNDPVEPLNRYFFALTALLDAFVLEPVAILYDWALPRQVKNSVSSFFNNLETPVTLANDLFQGEWKRAETTAMRFAINTTVGVGGLVDFASSWGYPYHSEDFGQTLAVYGVPEGPYLFLPLLGPSNPRDGVGYVADTFMDPMTYVLDGHDKVRIILFSTNAINKRAQAIEFLDEIERTSVDYYASLRSLSCQRRKDEIRNGEPDFDSLPDLTEIRLNDESNDIEKTPLADAPAAAPAAPPDSRT
jgi:phospholipid-binding lipoprotein MlaA